MSSMYSPTSLFGNAAYDVPTASAWCLWEENGTTPVTIDSAGVSGDVLYLSRGVRRIRFQNQNRFSSGGYVGFGLYENGNKAVATPTNNHAVLQMHGTTANNDVTNRGSSAACDVCVIGFDNIGSSTTYKNSLADSNSSFRVRGNAVFFSFRADSDTRKPYIGNHVRYSEKYDVSNWAKSSTAVPVAANDIPPPTEIAGASVWKFVPNAGVGYATSHIRQVNTGITLTKGTQYTVSAYVRQGDLPNHGYFLYARADLNSNRYFQAAFIPQRNVIQSLTTNDAATWSGITATMRSIDNGWYRISATAKYDSTIESNLSFQFYAGTTQAADADGIKGVYGTGLQMEYGSSPTPYVKTENNVPVYGNQELLINRNPGSIGYAGTTGATFSSHIAPFSVDPKLRATAWGTIVIPGVSGDSSSSVYTYLEDRSSRVVGVSAGKGVFTVLLDPPMGTTSYCVVACAEQEQYYGSETTAAAGALGSIPPKEEFPLLMIQNNDVNVPDDSRTKTSFTIKSLRQTTNYGSFLESNGKYMTTAGLNTRIHFLVFGGLTAYA